MPRINLRESVASSNTKKFKKNELVRNQSDKRYYQLEAYDNLTNFLNDNDRTAGLLVLPTGGGKTRVSITWAIDQAINNGYKILWLAHRTMLIQQAYDTFNDFFGLVDLSKKDSLGIRIISGDAIHSNIKDINFQEDDIVISTIQSISQNIGFLKQVIHRANRKSNVEKLLVIVDEAHHSTSSTYEKLVGKATDNKKTDGYFRRLKEDGKLKELKILGLTATPINSNAKTERKLIEFYDKAKPIYEIATSKLINSGILSRPRLYEIETKISIEASGKSDKEKEDNLNKQLVDSEERNKIIIDTYLHSFVKDKTLLFAVNIKHAENLKRMFELNNISCEVVHSKKDGNDIIIKKFQEKNSNLNLLINVEILTEGSDIPQIQTLFITRVVKSETLFTQMVGRALRGEDSGGTKEANIVTFADNITNFDILSLKGVFDDAGYSGEYDEKTISVDFWNNKKYSINEIQEELKKIHSNEDENGKLTRQYRNSLLNYTTMKALPFNLEKHAGKECCYILGKKLAGKRKDSEPNRYVWSFEAKEQFSFLDRVGRTKFNTEKNQEEFYFITQKVNLPKSNTAVTMGDIYTTWKNNEHLKGVGILPSYGIPIGEYILRFSDESTESIHIFKFQKNCYDNFFSSNPTINHLEKEDWMKEIREYYFKEAENFIPISDRILSILYDYVSSDSNDVEFIENDFETIDIVNEIIDEIVRKDTQEIENFNPRESYKDDNIKLVYSTLQDFRNEVQGRTDIFFGDAIEAGKIEFYDENVLKLSQYGYVNEEEFNSIHNIDELYESASQIVCNALGISGIQYAPKKATWTKRAYKTYFGMARGINMYTKSILNNKDKIEINSILCSPTISKHTIEFVLYHEILHFELRVLHDAEFNEWEQKYISLDGKYNFIDAEKELMQVSNWINENWTKKDKNKATIDNNSEWYLYDNRYHTKSQIRDIVTNENLTLPTMDELKKIVSIESPFYIKDVQKELRFYLSRNMNKKYSSFRVEGNHNIKKDSYMLIVKKEN